MDIDLIKRTIISTLSLLKNEVDTIEFEDLRMEYIENIYKLETLLKDLSVDEQMDT